MEKAALLVHVFMGCLLFPVEKSMTKKEELADLFHLCPAWLKEGGHIAQGAARSFLMNRAEQIAKSSPGRNGLFQVDGAEGSLGCPSTWQCCSELGTAIV